MKALKSFGIAIVLSSILFGGYFANLYNIRAVDAAKDGHYLTLADILSFVDFQNQTGEAFLWPLLNTTGILVAVISTIYFARNTILISWRKWLGIVGLFVAIFCLYIVSYWLLRGYMVQDLVNIGF